MSTRRAAIVTGASSGIGFALAEMLAAEGHALTLNSRRPERLEQAADTLRAAGCTVEAVAGDVADEQVVRAVVARHRERFGRLDVLVNNAGVGAGEPIGELTTKKLDLQLGANLRHVPLFYREALDLLRAAGEEHGNALVVNMSSISGKRGEGWLSVYSAVKHGVIGFTQAMNRELGALGVKSCALCPALVDTSMADFVRDVVPTERMIRTSDVAELVRALLRLSPSCTIPEIVFEQTAFDPGQAVALKH